MKNTITADDQIAYLESYANMLKAQHDMLQVQIKFLKNGKDMQDQFMSFFNPFFNSQPK